MHRFQPYRLPERHLQPNPELYKRRYIFSTDVERYLTYLLPISQLSRMLL